MKLHISQIGPEIIFHSSSISFPVHANTPLVLVRFLTHVCDHETSVLGIPHVISILLLVLSQILVGT